MPRTRSDAGPSRLSPRRHAPRRRLVAAACIVSFATVAFLGCASVLDIDHDYVLEPSELATGGSGSVGKGTGGRPGTGGTATGGTLASGGAGETAGSGGGMGDFPDAACVENGPGCSAGTKCCGGACVAPTPLVGCGANDCNPCNMPPASGTMVCAAGGTCAIKCNPTFVLNGALCEPEQANTGGAGGVSGSGGSTATGGAAPKCDAKLCPGCGPPGPFGCCKNDDQCGCSWTPSGSGYCL